MLLYTDSLRTKFMFTKSTFKCTDCTNQISAEKPIEQFREKLLGHTETANSETQHLGSFRLSVSHGFNDCSLNPKSDHTACAKRFFCYFWVEVVTQGTFVFLVPNSL